MTEPRDRWSEAAETAVRTLEEAEQRRLPKVEPRSWSLPPEPPAGTRLRGIVTVLRDGADHPCEYQRDTVFPDLWVEVGASHRRFTWGELLTREGPLTEVVGCTSTGVPATTVAAEGMTTKGTITSE